MNAKDIGNFLCQLRKEKELKQRELAEALHVSDKAISRWETGTGIPDVGSLQSLSEFFGVSINEILAGRRIKEDEVKMEADKNLTELVSRQAGMKKKLYIAMGAAVMAIVAFLGVAIVSLMPISGSSAAFEVSDMDRVIRYVRELEEAGTEYELSIDTSNQTITVSVTDPVIR